MPDGDKIKVLYNAVSKDYDLGTYDQFAQKLQDQNKRKALYDAIGKDYDLGDYTTFNSKLGFDSKEVQAQSQQEQPDPFQNAKPSTGIISNQRVLQGQQQAQANKDVFTDVRAANNQLQQSQKAADDINEERKSQAAANTAAVYFKNNPQLLPDNESLQLKNFGKQGKFDFTLKNLPASTAIQRKAAEIKNKLDNGQLITYTTDSGELRAAHPMTGLQNTISNFKQAWHASGEADKILSMSDEEFRAYANKPDNEFLPTKSNQESISGQVGQQLPIAIKGSAAAATGAVLAAASEATGGVSLRGLPIVMAWAFTAPDMAKIQAAQGKVRAYNEAIQQGKTPDEATQIANKMATADYAEGMALGTALTVLPSVIPRSASEGFLTSYGKYLAMQPYSAGAQGLGAGTLTALKDQYAKHLGLDVSNQDFENSFNGMAATALGFGVVYGLLLASGHTKAQANNVISKVPPETLDAMKVQAVKSGELTPEQVSEGDKTLADFNNAKTKIVPTGDEEKDAAIAGLIQKKDNLTKQHNEDLATKDQVFHDDLKKDYNAQVDDINNQIKNIKNGKPLADVEKDDVSGEKLNLTNEQPTTTTEEKAAIQSQEPIQEGTLGTTTENERVPSTEKSKTETNVGEVVQPQQEETKQVKLNDFVKDEMLSVIDARKDVVSDDPESASGIEKVKGGLDALKEKIESGNHNFTKDELDWLKEEVSDFHERTLAAADVADKEDAKAAKQALPKVKKVLQEISQSAKPTEPTTIPTKEQLLFVSRNTNESVYKKGDKYFKEGNGIHDKPIEISRNDAAQMAWEHDGNARSKEGDEGFVPHAKRLEVLDKYESRSANQQPSVGAWEKSKEDVVSYKGEDYVITKVNQDGSVRIQPKYNAKPYDEITVKPSEVKLIKTAKEIQIGRLENSIKDYESKLIENPKTKSQKENNSFLQDAIDKAKVELEKLKPTTTKETPTPETNIEEHPNIVELKNQRDKEIDEVTKPDVKLNLIQGKDLANAKDPLETKRQHTEIKERYKKLKQAADCIG